MSKVNSDNIPKGPKKLDQSVLWKYVKRKGEKKPTKVPYQPNGKPASSTDPETWSDYNTVMKVIDKFDGIGFVLTKDDPYVVIDFDHCKRKGVKGPIRSIKDLIPEVAKVVRMLNGYVEVSPSGEGIHIWIKGSPPKDAPKKSPGIIEIYSHGRYMTVTGNRLEGVGTKGIPKRQKELDALYKIYFRGAVKKKGSGKQGKWSPSEKDQSFCNHLANAGKSEEEIDQAYRSSDRYRPKWDEPRGESTYGKITIRKALEGSVPSLAMQGQQGAAKLAIRIHNGQYVYDHSTGVWYLWGGQYWEKDRIEQYLQDLDCVQEKFRSAYRELINQISESADPKEREKQLKKLTGSCLDQIHRLHSRDYRKKVAEFAAQGVGSLGISGNEWDRHPWLLPCPNGVINLKNGEIADGSPDQYIKTYCPTIYDPDAKCQRFILFLEEIFNHDHEMICFIQRILGMSLVGEQVEHKLIIMWGKGRNGKDTLMETIAHTLGEIAAHTKPELLIGTGYARSASAPDSAAIRLRSKRVVWTSETSESARFNASALKALTGGGRITARGPYERYEVEFPMSHTLFLMTNHKPHASAKDYALWKRFILIPFERAFVSNPQEKWESLVDLKLPEKLKAEAPGILRWMVEGCLEWQEKGLCPPEKVQKAVEEYRNSEDILSQFIKECCDVKTEAIEASGKLYEAYSEWCGDNCLKQVMTVTAFGREMDERFEKKRVRSGTVITGIKLRRG